MDIHTTSERMGTPYHYIDNVHKQVNAKVAKNNGGSLDTVTFSKEGKEALARSLEPSGDEQIASSSKGVKIIKSDNRYRIDFENVAYVYRAIKNGYIDIGGKKLLFTDEDKENLKSAADETSKQMEQDLLQATAEHEAHVAKQQAEALSEEAKHQSRILEIASKIMKGEKVSPEEENELAESNPKLYAMAKQAQMLEKESDKHHKKREIGRDRDEQQDNKSSKDEDEEWVSPLKQMRELSVSMDVENADNAITLSFEES